MSVQLEPNLLVSLLEQTLLFLLIVCRWLLPRGDITRHELSQLLFVFLGIASDNMTLFDLFHKEPVRKDKALTYVIMVVWTFSFMQFLFVLTSTKGPQEISVALHQPDGAASPSPSSTSSSVRRQERGMLSIIFTTEIWSLLFSVLTQDAPYAAVRIYALVHYELITYSIIYFICKNVLVVILVLYRLLVICIHKHFSKDDDEEDESERGVRQHANGCSPTKEPKSLSNDDPNELRSYQDAWK